MDIEIIIVLSLVVFLLGMLFSLTIQNLEVDKSEIKTICGYIFNPATTLSNYTSYKHCLEYPQTYGVNK